MPVSDHPPAPSAPCSARASVKFAQKSSGCCSWTRRRKPTPFSRSRTTVRPAPAATVRAAALAEAALASSARAFSSLQAAGLRHPVAPGVGVARRATRSSQSCRAESGAETAQSSSAVTMSRPISRPGLAPRPPPGRWEARPALVPEGLGVVPIRPGLVEVAGGRHGSAAPRPEWIDSGGSSRAGPGIGGRGGLPSQPGTARTARRRRAGTGPAPVRRRPRGRPTAAATVRLRKSASTAPRRESAARSASYRRQAR